MSSTSSEPIVTRHLITEDWQCIMVTPGSSRRESPYPSSDTVAGAEMTALPGLQAYGSQDIVKTKAELERVMQSVPLPPKSSVKIFRPFWISFLSTYRILFLLVVLGNLAAMILFLYGLAVAENTTGYGNAATAAAANFCAAVMARNEHIVNGFFRVAVSLPIWTPLALRRRVAKVYSYGGVHTSCAVSGASWYLVYAVLSIRRMTDGPAETVLAVTTGVTLALLLLVIFFALPSMRMRLHNHFEATHRYGGWSLVALLWMQTMLLVNVMVGDSGNFGVALVCNPPFWLLTVITCLLIYPWLRLRSRNVRVEALSRHATRLHFDYDNMETCLGVRLTDAPMRETHAFATIPNYTDGEKGFSILMSNAGDWTNKIIQNPPSKIYVKGAPSIGVMRVALLFKKVLIVSTGSGIGPCLSLLQAHPDYSTRTIWSASDPEGTFGKDIIRAVFRSDPDAMIIDTKRTGRPDLVALAYAIFVASKCEAVVAVSNPVVTKKVIYGLEARGIPAYGPIFDS